ncbi:DUF3142 domain-containing protein [Pseudonocardia sp. TMWB2A]
MASIGGCEREAARTVCAPVDAAHYDAFWLWAGVKPQPVLEQAKRLYILEAEVVGRPGRLAAQREAAPRLGTLPVFLVIRVETLDWVPEVEAQILSAITAWERNGTRVAGLQIDFDARTRQLDRYAGFLKSLRERLPRRYALSVTGLLDWSANADSQSLNALGQVVDEVVLQTYQGRATVAGYDQYLDRLKRLHVPFRLGLVQGGDWCARPDIAENPAFKGYVVFLLNSRGS